MRKQLNLVFFLVCLSFFFNVFYEDKGSPFLYKTAAASENIDTETKTTIEPVTNEAEQILLARNITRIYKNISYQEALYVVKQTYEYARIHSINPNIFLGIIATESKFNKYAVSAHGAKGYSQVMPSYHKSKIGNRNIHDTKTNIEVGVSIYGECYSRFKNNKQALGCYNGSINNKEKMNEYIKLVYYNKYKIIDTSSI